MNKREAFQEMIKILEDIDTTDNKILEINKRLKIVLINLKIESAHIKDNNGIMPIADELEQMINQIDDNLKKLIKNDKTKIVEAMKILKED